MLIVQKNVILGRKEWDQSTLHSQLLQIAAGDFNRKGINLKRFGQECFACHTAGSRAEQASARLPAIGLAATRDLAYWEGSEESASPEKT